MSAGPIMPHPATRLQSTHAGIRRKTGRTGTLRDHDGCTSWTPRRYHGHDHRRHGISRPARSLLPEPALARQTRDGHPDHHEEPDRRERADPERHGRAEEERLSRRPGATFVSFPASLCLDMNRLKPGHPERRRRVMPAYVMNGVSMGFARI